MREQTEHPLLTEHPPAKCAQLLYANSAALVFIYVRTKVQYSALSD